MLLDDITERKLAEEALRASEARQSVALQTGKLAYWEYGFIVVQAEIQKALETTDPNYSVQLDHRFLYADGGMGYMTVRFRIEKDNQGRTIKSYGANQDITERRRAEDALAASEQRYRWLFEHMAEGYACCQMIFENGHACDWVYLAVNDAFQTLTGLKDVVGKRVSEVIPGLRETDPTLFDIYARVALTGQPEKFETFVEALQMWFSVSVYCPETGYFVAVFDVITERKRAEQALRQSEQRLFLHLHQTLLGVIEWDTDFRIVKWNSAAERIFGYTEEEVLGKHASNLITPAALKDHVDQVCQSLLKRKGGDHSINENLTKAGRSILCEWYNTPLIAEDGKVIGVASLVQDISEQKRAEEALQTSEEYARSIVESSLDMIISTDSQRRIVEFNRAAQEAFGYRREEVIGKHVDILYDNPHEGTVKNRNVLESGKIVGEIANRRKNGERFISFLSATVLRNSKGELIGTVGVSRDITEQKQAEEMLRRRANELAVLHAVSAACVEITDENALIERVTKVIGENLFANNLGLLLVDETNSILRMHSSYHIHEEVKELAIPLGKGVTGWVAANGQPRRIDDIAGVPEYEEIVSGMKSELCVPLKVGERVIGVINAENEHRYAYTEADEWIMLTLAGQLAMAIDRLRAEADLNRMATMDELTGVYNRRAFFALAERELKRDHLSNRPTCAIMLDIDHFKQINDHYGHQTGDKVLRGLADCCKRSLREADLIGRYGGEEFIILLPSTNASKAHLVAERLRADVEKCSLMNERDCPKVTISLGVAQANGKSPDLSKLLNNADIALYAAKQSGRNRVIVADDDKSIGSSL